jgi:predicted AAA+ superfamily ATPase
MLSSELSTLLTGRAKQIKVFPLTFKEFVEASKNTKNIYESFHDYAEIGGLGLIIPDINNIERAKENLLDVLQDTIRKDIENKHHSTKNISIEKTIKYVLNNIGKPISSHKTVQHTNVNSESKINHVSFARYLK